MSTIRLSKEDVNLAIQYYVKDKMGMNRVALPGDVKILTRADSTGPMNSTDHYEAEVSIKYRKDGDDEPVDTPFAGMFEHTVKRSSSGRAPNSACANH